MTKGHKDSTLYALSLESTRNVWPRKSHKRTLKLEMNFKGFHFENFDSHLS